MEYIRNYNGLSMEQKYTFKMLYERFSMKDTTVLKEGVNSIILKFNSEASMKVWDAIVKKEGLA